ncbi:hypothetical protein ACFYW9_41080 [Streptomyces sp. NPDC002698]|uniref:hypothetical protein n=1 Tax=Streptomyces sp. NPDC002698 TaxID=3364660 RepID=UPI0036BE1393
MDTETPTDAEGNRLCAWCGEGPVPPSRGTKPRAYCSRSCVQRAHEARKLQRKLLNAYMKGRADEVELRPRKSHDFPAGDRGKSQDFADGTSRDFPKQQVTPPDPPARPDGWVRSEDEINAQLAELEQRRTGQPDAQPPTRDA